MKIESLRIDNIHCLKTVDVTLPNGVTLVAGPNGAGKSSFLEAIRFAMAGEILREQYKKNWKAVVRAGEKNAAVAVEFAGGGRAQGVLPSGKQAMTPPITPALAMLLDPPRFARQTADERRKFLFDVLGINIGTEALARRLIARGCDANLLAGMGAILRTGFDQAEKHAAAKMAEHRARWSAITGEEYGSIKAISWAAPYGPKDEAEAALGIIETQVSENKAALDALQNEYGAAENQLRIHERYRVEREDLEARSAKLEALKKDARTADRAATAAQEDLEKARAALEQARLTCQFCPECNTPLASRNGKLIKVEPPTDEGIAAAESALAVATGALKAMQTAATERRAERDDAQRAADTLDSLLKSLGEEVTQAQINSLSQRIANAEDRRVRLHAERDEARAAVSKAATGAEQTIKAKAEHDAIKAWELIREAVSPAGVPGDLLAEAITPINERLRISAEVAAWPVPRLDENMEIVANDMAYRLWSESYRWRFDALLNEAVSFVSGTKFLMLDRLDVIEPAGRMSAIGWARWLCDAQGYGSVLLAATLKAKPAIEGVNVVWLAGGEVA